MVDPQISSHSAISSSPAISIPQLRLTQPLNLVLVFPSHQCHLLDLWRGGREAKADLALRHIIAETAHGRKAG